MKKIIYIIIFALFMFAPNANASSVWNSVSNDCNTVTIANVTTNTGYSSTCWGLSSVSASAGDKISVRIYYHNTSSTNNTNTTISLSQSTNGPSSNYTFTGNVNADQGSVSGSASLNLSSSQTLTIEKVGWFPNQTSSNPQSLSTSILNGSVSIGTVGPDSSFSYWGQSQGSVVVVFNVGNTQSNPPQSNFSVTTDPTPSVTNTTAVVYGSYAQGAGISTWFEYGVGSPSQATYNLGSNQTFSTTLTNLSPNTYYAYRACAATSSQSKCGQTYYFTTNGNVVNPPQNLCKISSFQATPNYINQGSSSTLYWATSGCNSASITNVGSVAMSGNTSVSPSITTTYNLVAYGSNGNDSSYQTITVNPNYGGGGNTTVTPTITTYNPNYISTNSATLIGYANGNGPLINAWIEYPCYGSQYGNVNNVTSTNLSTSIYFFSPNTTYSYCAVAQNLSTGQIARGNVVSFTTTSNQNYYPNNSTSPSVTTYQATNISTTSATFNGYVDGNQSYTTRWFRYGTNSSNLLMTTNLVNHGTGGQSISDSVYNLSPNTTYYFQAVAQNSYGTNYGSILSFSTNSSFIPGYNNGNTSVLTTLATGVGQTSAQINGLLQNTTNGSTNVYFEYGPTVSMGLRTAVKNIGFGTSLPFSEMLTNLAPDTIYYFRANAENSNGVSSRGTIEIFNTLGTNARPVIVTGTTRVGLESPVMLKIENRYENIGVGDIVDYTVTYKNIGNTRLNKPLLQVIIPQYLGFINASRGTYSDLNHTLNVQLEDLTPNAGGVVYVQAKVISLPNDRSDFVSTAMIVYTNSKGAQENAIAYVLNKSKGVFTNVNTNTNLSAAAFFAGIGFPGTFLGWLLWFILILLIILIVRTFLYKREEPPHNNNHH